MSPTLYEPTDEEVRSGALGLQLRQFNYTHIGEYPQQHNIRFNAKDEQAAEPLVGGIRAFVFMGWLDVEVLWVAQPARGAGLGSRLLKQTENRAQTLGASNARLTTFDWQAEVFYARHGYTVFARMDNYFRGRDLLMMKKAL